MVFCQLLLLLHTACQTKRLSVVRSDYNLEKKKNLTGSFAYQRLYREGVSKRHDAVVHVVLVVQDVRVGVKRFSDAVSTCREKTNK